MNYLDFNSRDSNSGRYYILDRWHKTHRVGLMTWARWHDAPLKRRVGWTRVGRKSVSTVFLGINHNWFDDEHPILFETMIYNNVSNTFDSYQERYHTWDEAVKGHAQTVRRLRRRKRVTQ